MRQTWEEVKERKECIRDLGLGSYFCNEVLMQKAVGVAVEILKHGFVKQVGLFGSTARGEDGSDVDLVIIDDGTISIPALSRLKRSLELGLSLGFPCSGGSYSNICYQLFAEHFPGSFDSQFFCYLREKPMAVDLIFLSPAISRDQEYLDELALCMSDPFFFRNISDDILIFHSGMRGFGKGFPRFVSNGMPSAATRAQIEAQEERALKQQKERIAQRMSRKREVSSWNRWLDTGY